MLDLVFGAYGEASDGMKKLLGQIVETRVSSHARYRKVLVGEAALCWRGSRSSWEEERKRRPKSGQGQRKRMPGLRGKPTGLRGLLLETFPGEETFHI